MAKKNYPGACAPGNFNVASPLSGKGSPITSDSPMGGGGGGSKMADLQWTVAMVVVVLGSSEELSRGGSVASTKLSYIGSKYINP